jgi:hypothetical protein
MSVDPGTPEYRASDADREQAAERLRRAAVEGRLESAEFEQRVTEAYAARTMTELDRLTSDLTPPAPMTPPPPPMPAPPPYGYQPQPYAYPVKSNGFAIASLVLGICWIWWLGSVLAVVFGHVALNQISKSQGRESGQGMAVAGLVLGYLGVATLAIVLLVGIGN